MSTNLNPNAVYMQRILEFGSSYPLPGTEEGVMHTLNN